jgi:hypothetical protein
MRAIRSVGLVAITFALALMGAACSSSGKSSSASTSTTQAAAPAIVWPAPPDPLVRARAAGLVPETAEHLTYHVHAHLDVFVNGQPVTVPAGLGINIHDPGVHTFETDGATSYGGINPPCDQPCISPLHTHDISGVIHTESATVKDNTLGQFFTEWAVRLDDKCVQNYCRPGTKIAVFVDGTPFAGDPRTIDLANLKEIAIVIGSPPAQIPSVGDFSSL